MTKMGPLAGLRVLDCSAGSAGPQASGILADYGAEVTWVEPPGGDPWRILHPAATSVFNRGKRSIALDIESPEGRDRVLKLAAQADIFIEGWSPGQADRAGLGYEAMRALNPQIIYCSISGFGENGPWRDVPAYESLVHTLMGTTAYQAGHRDGPIYQGLPFASAGAAQLAVLGILAALYRRLEDGRSRRVETSLLDGALAYHSMLWGESDASLAAAGAAGTSGRFTLGRATTRMVTRSFLCSDGEYLGVHTGAVGAFGRLMKVLGLDDRIKPSATGHDLGTPLTAEEADILEANIHQIFAAHPRDYWVQRMIQEDICAVEHFRPTACFDQPQTRHNGMVVTLDDPVLGAIEQVAPGIRFDGAAPPPLDPAPAPGAHTAQILAELERPAEPSSWRGPQGADTGRAADAPLLAGVRIIDFGGYFAGPFSSRLLADLGADVLKIETTIGDQVRGIDRVFFAANAGKRALAVNLKDADVRPAIERLLKSADIIHHNMRPGAAERLGMGAEQVRAVNPDVIYAYAPGWGSTGPFAMRQSFAPMLAGYVGASYEVAGQYNEPMPSVGNEDPGNGMLGATAMLLALLQRRRTGHAAYCENPQLNAALGLVSHIVRGPDGEPIGAAALDVNQMGVAALDSLYETSDGWICVAARSDDEIRALETLLKVQILGDARFATAQLRQEHRDDLADILREAFGSRGSDEWLASAGEARANLAKPAEGAPSHDLLNDPVHRVSGRIAEATHPDKGKVREVGKLVRVSGAVRTPHRLAPGLGEHSDAVLLGADYTAEQIAELRAKGSVAGRSLPAPLAPA